MSRRKDGRPRTTANPEFAHWMRELGKSNTTQPHVSKRYKREKHPQKSINNLKNEQED